MDAWEQLLSTSQVPSGDAWEHLLAQGGGMGEGTVVVNSIQTNLLQHSISYIMIPGEMTAKLSPQALIIQIDTGDGPN